MNTFSQSSQVKTISAVGDRLLFFLYFAFLVGSYSFPSNAADQADSNSVSILTYNVFLRSPTWIFFRDNHNWRTDYIAKNLRGYDAVVLQEAFSERHREQITEELNSEYPYHSKILGGDTLFRTNGGVVILSRWPILAESETVFSNCEGADCMVRKGVVYVKIDKLGQPYHLFGLHLQAEIEYADARLSQLPEIRSFIDQQNIPDSEPTFIAGDFNLNYFSNFEDGELDTAFETLSVELLENQPTPSYSSATNVLLDDYVRERLDYVFYSLNHRQPASASSQVIFIREQDKDLSDHHGVVGHFSFNPRQ